MKIFIPLCSVLLAGSASIALAEEAKIDNGTNPTIFSNSFAATFEHLDLSPSGNSNSLKLNLSFPMGANSDWTIKFKVPVQSVDVLGNNGYALGDASITIGHVFGLTEKQGFAVLGEMIFDTADRPELGTGKNVFKGTFAYVKFLESGAIFAPTLVQSNSFSGDSNRAKVNMSTIDFYYVPQLANPKNLITFDPSINKDWESNKEFLGLAVTYGRVLGKAFGGNAIATVKPSVSIGSDRPNTWGVELGYKVIGF